MPMTTLHEMFVHGLRDMYHAEKQLTKALPRMARAANDAELRAAFESHLEETNGQIETLEQVFESLNVAARGVRCEAIEGLVAESREIIEGIEDERVRDAGLVLAARKVEHYEIASYSALAEVARELGKTEAAKLLSDILQQESAADSKLGKLAASGINKAAARDGRGSSGAARAA